MDALHVEAWSAHRGGRSRGRGVAARSYARPMELEFSGEIWFWRGPSLRTTSSPSPTTSAGCHRVDGLSSQLRLGMIPVSRDGGRDRLHHVALPEGRRLRRPSGQVRHAEDLDVGDVITVRHHHRRRPPRHGR